MAEEKAKEAAAEAVEATQEVVTETVEEVAPVKEETPKVDPQEFLNNFDWDKYEEGIERVDDTKLQEFEYFFLVFFV